MSVNNQAFARGSLPRLALAAALILAIAACGKDEGAAPATDAAGTAAATSAAGASQAGTSAVDAAEQAAIQADALAELGADELRERGRAAYAESRLYAPAGDNALEYYLALREKSASDAAVASALTDLMPMLVIATEQARDREDFEEARRLAALVGRADANHPSLQRLQATIVTAEEGVDQRIAQQALSAEQEVERQRQLAVERERAQADEQRQASEQLAQQQRDEAEAAERAEAERVAAAARAAEQRAAEQRQAQQAAATTPAPAAAPTLRPLSTPAPRYPTEALRAAQAGEVQVEFTVAADGSVTDARVVRADPPRVFDREAVAAVRRWRFEPVSEPVTTRRTIAFNPGG